MNTATPLHGRASGFTDSASRSTTTFSQSSMRPIISVTTGPIDPVGRPAASRRASPRSIAMAACTAWATVKLTVTLTLMPRAVASSIATSPADVAGSFTMMFGAIAWNRIACSSISAGER